MMEFFPNEGIYSIINFMIFDIDFVASCPGGKDVYQNRDASVPSACIPP